MHPVLYSPLAFTFENPESGTLTENLTFIGLGFGYVVFTLLVMFLLTELVGVYFKKKAAKEMASAPAPVPVIPAPQAPETDPRLVAVIAAALKATLDESHRIVSIRASMPDWSREGRRAIFDSHRISRNR